MNMTLCTMHSGQGSSCSTYCRYSANPRRPLGKSAPARYSQRFEMLSEEEIMESGHSGIGCVVLELEHSSPSMNGSSNDFLQGNDVIVPLVVAINQLLQCD